MSLGKEAGDSELDRVVLAVEYEGNVAHDAVDIVGEGGRSVGGVGHGQRVTVHVSACVGRHRIRHQWTLVAGRARYGRRHVGVLPVD
jgi:hypothetical protein